MATVSLTPDLDALAPAHPAAPHWWRRTHSYAFIALLLAEVLEMLKPIHNWFYIEGRPENNDEPGH